MTFVCGWLKMNGPVLLNPLMLLVKNLKRELGGDLYERISLNCGFDFLSLTKFRGSTLQKVIYRVSEVAIDISALDG
jgi:hypothetical protein